MTTTMSKASAIEQLQRMGVTYVGPEDWKKILNAAETPTRRPTRVMEQWGHEVTPQADSGGLTNSGSAVPDSGRLTSGIVAAAMLPNRGGSYRTTDAIFAVIRNACEP
jgi:hypothetical protein